MKFLKLNLLFWMLGFFPITGFCFSVDDAFLEKPRAEWEERGLSFEAAYFGDFFSNMQGGHKEKSTYLGDLDLGITYDLGKAGLIPGGKIYVSGNETHGGENLTAKYVGDLQGVDNLEAPNSMRFYEWWYEQNLWNDRLSVLAGVEALDSEFALSEYGGLFLHSSFGTPADLSWNVPLSSFPSVGPALRIKISPIKSLEFRYGLFDGDPSDGGKNHYNAGYRLARNQGFLHIFEAAYHFEIPFQDLRFPGTLKFGSWTHTQNLDDVLGTDDTGAFVRHARDYGFYGVLDQMVFRESAESDQGLGAFFQLGGVPEDRNFLDLYFGTGLQYKGLFPKRDEDRLGIAVANAFISDKARAKRDLDIQGFDSTAPEAGPIPSELLSSENALEVTYRIQVHKHLALQPSYATVFHPGAEQNARTAHVFMLRVEINY